MTEAQAKRRFLTLTAVRLIALLVVLAGVANIAGKLFPSATPAVGYILLIFGILDFFLAPIAFKRMWREKDE